MRLVVRNLIDQFNSLNQRGDRIGSGHGFPRVFRDKRYSTFHKHGGRDNHFQGVQRIGRHLLITGSYPYRGRRSDLFVVRLDTRSPDSGPWGSNMLRSRDPDKTDRLTNYFKIDGEYWHPGGFSMLGTTAVVPLEDSEGRSKIVFVDVSDPDNPSVIPNKSIRRGDSKAGACAVTQLGPTEGLLAVWSDSDFKKPGASRNPPYHLDLYRFDPTDLPGNQSRLAPVAQYFPTQTHSFHRKFQSLDFVWDKQDDGSEQLHLLGYENVSDVQPNPLDPGKNVGLVFRVDLDSIPSSPPAAGNPTPALPSSFVSKKAEREFQTSGNWCNMDAGTGTYVDSSRQLIVYSVYHFMARVHGRNILTIKALEFRATNFTEEVTRLEDGWVDVYEDLGLDGRRLSILGPWDASIEDTDEAFVDDRSFAAAASVRYQIPDGLAYVLYPDKRFSGAGALVLAGDGMRKEIDLLTTDFEGHFRSARFQLESVARALPGAIIV